MSTVTTTECTEYGVEMANASTGEREVIDLTWKDLDVAQRWANSINRCFVEMVRDHHVDSSVPRPDAVVLKRTVVHSTTDWEPVQ